MSRADITLVIVNYNGRDYIGPCLDSLPAGVPVVVVDNASRDGSPDEIAAKHPKAVLIRNESNAGFARAVNQGVAASRTTYVCLLNPDARLQPGALEALAGRLDAHPDEGMAAPQLLHEDGRRQHSFDNFPSLATAFLNKSLLRLLAPRRYPSKRHELPGPTAVESVIGACMMVRRSLIDRIGGLDEAYFLFLEETDWCLRAWKAGSKVVCVPEARVVHLQGRAKDRVRVRARVEYIRSLHLYFRKNRPCQAGCFAAFLPIKSFIELLFGIFALPTAKGRRRWVETGAVLGWSLFGHPAKWGLSRARAPRQLQMSDGTWALEAHAAAFNRFDEKRRQIRILEETDGKRRMEFTAEGRVYLLKAYKPSGFGARLKALLGASKVAHERAMSLGLLEKGIPCAPVVATRDKAAERWAAVEKIPGARTVQEALLDPARPSASRRRLCRDYGRFARRLLDAGVWQYDFNPSNVLMDGDRLLLIDFERMRLYPGRVPEGERRYLLAKMHRLPDLGRTDRLRFLKAYLDADAVEAGAWKSIAKDLLARHGRQRGRDDARAERRCVEENRDYARFEQGEFWGWYLRKRPERDGGLEAAQIEALAAGTLPGRWEEQADAMAAWTAQARPGSGPQAVLVKKGARSGRLFFA